MTPTEKFCRILKQRSLEHQSAGRLMVNNGLYGQLISILRQELDSMVRVIFLLNQDLPTRRHFMGQTLQNTKWTLPNSRTTVTDRQMVDLSDRLFGWASSVYKLGCAFIHLSPMVDYKNENPFLQLSPIEVADIKVHLNNYHGFPMANDLDMVTIRPYLLSVLDKVSINLGGYIRNLEGDSTGMVM